jgi:hypothetical protein
MVADWIYDANLPVFLQTLGWIAGYQFEPEELAVIATAVAQETDGDAGRWYKYHLPGQNCGCDAEFALDPGSCVIQVRLRLPELQAAQAQVAVLVCQCFHLRNEKAPTRAL